MATVKVTREMADKAAEGVDWARIDAMTDEDIERQAAENLDAAPIMTGDEPWAIVRETRKRLGLSQAAFAARYHIPAGTLRDWEQNRKKPDSTALAFLKVIAKEPDVVAKALEGAA